MGGSPSTDSETTGMGPVSLEDTYQRTNINTGRTAFMGQEDEKANPVAENVMLTSQGGINYGMEPFEDSGGDGGGGSQAGQDLSGHVGAYPGGGRQFRND